MAVAVKNTEHGIVDIRLEFGTELADNPIVLGEAVGHNLFKIRERNDYIKSIRSVDVQFPLDKKHRVIADISLYITVVAGDVEQDCTALKQEIATRISEACKGKMTNQ